MFLFQTLGSLQGPHQELKKVEFSWSYLLGSFGEIDFVVKKRFILWGYMGLVFSPRVEMENHTSSNVSVLKIWRHQE